LIEESEVESKQQKTRELAIEVERMQEALKDLSIQEISISTQEIIREGILTSNALRAHQQHEATMLGEYKNKRNTETQITGKKARKLSKKKFKLGKLHEVSEKTSQEAGL
jgi:hypothetical protein